MTVDAVTSAAPSVVSAPGLKSTCPDGFKLARKAHHRPQSASTPLTVIILPDVRFLLISLFWLLPRFILLCAFWRPFLFIIRNLRFVCRRISFTPLFYLGDVVFSFYDVIPCRHVNSVIPYSLHFTLAVDT